VSHTFAGEVKRLMKDRHLTNIALAATVGVNRRAVSGWRSGRYVPLHDTVLRIADALMAEQLVGMSLRLRMGRCEACSRPVVSQGRGPAPRRYCDPRCKSTAAWRRRKAVHQDSIAFSKIRLAEHQQAVAAFCLGCEPEGICRTADCPLRAVSPLPFVAMRAA